MAALTGKEVFSTPLGPPSYSSPALDMNGVFYIGAANGNVYAINSTSGARVWAYATQGPIFATPALSSLGLVFIPSFDGRLYALYGTSGSLAWSVMLGGQLYSSPALGSDEKVYVGCGQSGSLVALSPAGGAVLWNLTVGLKLLYASPTIDSNSVLYMGTDNGACVVDACNTSRLPPAPV